MGNVAHNLLIAALVSVAAVAGLACSSASSPTPASFAGEPYTSTTSESGALHIDVRTSPQPPARGTNEVQLTITNAADGTPRDDLDVTVMPWMPAMNHGSASTPTVTPEGEGKYLVDGVYLIMPGVWELRMTLSSGAVMDHATASLSIS